jgi:hypothetical protein
MAAREGLTFSDGNAANTGEQSNIYLHLNSQSMLKMDETTHIEVNQISPRSLSLTLIEGAVVTDIIRDYTDETFEIKAGNMVFGVRGTSFIIECRKETPVFIMLYGSGEVFSVSDTGQTVILTAGNVARFEAEKIVVAPLILDDTWSEFVLTEIALRPNAVFILPTPTLTPVPIPTPTPIPQPIIAANPDRPFLGNGTAEAPFLFSEPEHFTWIADNWRTYENAHFLMTSDIISPNNWNIDITTARPFLGVFDGGGFTLTVNSSSTNVATGGGRGGLFRALGNGSIVRNITIDGVVHGTTRIGGVSGSSRGATIHNTHVNATVSASSATAGGLVGEAVNTTITDSTSSGNVTSRAMSVGGIVGIGNGSHIINSHTTGNITGSQRVGGIIGENRNGGTVENSTATGTITGAGLFVGGGTSGQLIGEER